MDFLFLSMFFIIFSRTSSSQDFINDSMCNMNDKYFKRDAYNATIKVGNPPKEINIAKYYSVRELQELFRDLSENYYKIFNFISLGNKKGAKCYPIWAVQISRDVGEDRPIKKPMFKFVANIRGDHTVGYGLMVSLIQYLLYNDGHDTRITQMLDNIDIWIVPNINLFGSKISSEGQMRSIYETTTGLDEDFPRKNWNKKRVLKFETSILTNFIQDNPFVLSGNLQGEAIVASYPLDYSPDMGPHHQCSGKTLDDDIFEKLALEYSQNNFMMAPGNACNQSFEHGITNGYKWKNIRGGMQDFNYFHSNCFELTFHLSCCKYPNSSDLPLYWNANLESMLRFIESTRRGVYGVVADDWTKRPIENATITVAGKGKVVTVTQNGEYWRLLNLGVYNVTASAPGFESQTASIDVNSTHPYVYHDFILKLKPKKRIRFPCLHQ